MRWVAKNIVAAGLAARCEAQVAYAIGVADPVSIMIDTFGTSAPAAEAIEDAVSQVFDLKPNAIIEALNLRRRSTSPPRPHGHFGRAPEKRRVATRSRAVHPRSTADRAAELRRAAERLPPRQDEGQRPRALTSTAGAASTHDIQGRTNLRPPDGRAAGPTEWAERSMPVLAPAARAASSSENATGRRSTALGRACTSRPKRATLAVTRLPGGRRSTSPEAPTARTEDERRPPQSGGCDQPGIKVFAKSKGEDHQTLRAPLRAGTRASARRHPSRWTTAPTSSVRCTWIALNRLDDLEPPVRTMGGGMSRSRAQGAGGRRDRSTEETTDRRDPS